MGLRNEVHDRVIFTLTLARAAGKICPLPPQAVRKEEGRYDHKRASSSAACSAGAFRMACRCEAGTPDCSKSLRSKAQARGSRRLDPTAGGHGIGTYARK